MTVIQRASEAMPEIKFDRRFSVVFLLLYDATTYTPVSFSRAVWHQSLSGRNVQRLQSPPIPFNRIVETNCASTAACRASVFQLKRLPFCIQDTAIHSVHRNLVKTLSSFLSSFTQQFTEDFMAVVDTPFRRKLILPFRTHCTVKVHTLLLTIFRGFQITVAWK